MKVIVASENPVKLNAVKQGFEKMFPGEQFHFTGISAASGVSDQPSDSGETLKGAVNRIASSETLARGADYYVGLEGGIETVGDEMEAFAWVVVKSGSVLGKARTCTFYLPGDVIACIRQGKELGEADDLVFGTSNSKQKNGAVGILTGNVIERTEYYADAVVLALIPFKNPELYRAEDY